MRARAVGLALIVLATACAGSEAETAPDRGRLVVAELATTGIAEERVSLLGDVQGEVEVRVFAQVPERIRVLHVHEGDVVHAGDPIATLDADLQASGVAQAGAAVSVGEAARDQLAAELARAQRLAASGALPTAQVDALAAQLRTSEAQVAQLSAVRRGAGEQRARTVIRAPVDGMVALLTVQDGDTVAPTMPICSIVRTERVEVVLRVTEQDYVRIREGMEVLVTPVALPDAARTGVVSRVSPVIDRMTRTATIEVTVENADGRIRPGMIAQTAIIIARREGVTLAPARGVVMTPSTDTDRSAFVFVVDETDPAALVARRRDVHIGSRFDDRMELVDGIAPGDRVIVEGQHLLRDGARIRITERAVVAAEASGGAR